MLLHGLEVSLVTRQQKGLLQSIGHIPGLSLLKIPYGGISGQGGSIQHQEGGGSKLGLCSSDHAPSPPQVLCLRTCYVRF